jgi:predicted amidohydrolase
MARVLPVLLLQQTGLSGEGWEERFEVDLRARLAEFPHSRLVLYPELHLCPPGTAEQIEAMAEPIDGPRVKFLRELASDLRIWLVPGSVYERDEDGRVYNTAVAISPGGEIAARYRKCFPWRPWEPVTPGREFVVFDIPGLTRVGISICYDTWFPEVARHLAWMGAEVILQPTLTPTADRPQELVLSQATAITNQVFVVSLNAAAPQATGRSAIIDPEGTVLYEAGEAAVPITRVLNLDLVQTAREYGTAGLNRLWAQFRPEDAPIPMPLYGGALDPARWGAERESGEPTPSPRSVDPATGAVPAEDSVVGGHPSRG